MNGSVVTFKFLQNLPQVSINITADKTVVISEENSKKLNLGRIDSIKEFELYDNSGVIVTLEDIQGWVTT